jgi:hypothetical protein
LPLTLDRNKTMSQETENTQATISLTNDTFFFRPRKIELDTQGLPIPPKDSEDLIKGKDGKPDMIKRKTLTLGLPYVKTDDLIDLLNDEKTAGQLLAFMVDLANDKVYEAAQGQVNNLIAAGIEPSNETIKVSELELMWLAVQPKITSRGISKELYAEFKVDFINTMTAKFGISPTGADKAARLIADDKLQSIKTQPQWLNAIKAYISQWFSGTSPESQQKFEPIATFFLDKIEGYLATPTESWLDAIK